MSNNLNDVLGVTDEAVKESTGAVQGEFKLLVGGVYKATIVEVAVWTNKFGQKELQHTVNITAENRDLNFRKNVSPTLQNGKTNGAFMDRFKMFAYAAGVDFATLVPTAGKVTSYGQEYDAQIFSSLAGAEILAEVNREDDIGKEEGEAYKYSNAIAGVLKLDGTDATGEKKDKAFAEKSLAKPIVKYGKKAEAPAAGGATTGTASAEVSAAMQF